MEIAYEYGDGTMIVRYEHGDGTAMTSYEYVPRHAATELICENSWCGNPGQLVIDPYDYGLYDEENEVVLCDQCYQERTDDI